MGVREAPRLTSLRPPLLVMPQAERVRREARDFRDREVRDQSLERQKDLIKSMKLKDRRKEEARRIQKDQVSGG